LSRCVIKKNGVPKKRFFPTVEIGTNCLARVELTVDESDSYLAPVVAGGGEAVDEHHSVAVSTAARLVYNRARNMVRYMCMKGLQYIYKLSI